MYPFRLLWCCFSSTCSIRTRSWIFFLENSKWKGRKNWIVSKSPSTGLNLKDSLAWAVSAVKAQNKRTGEKYEYKLWTDTVKTLFSKTKCSCKWDNNLRKIKFQDEGSLKIRLSNMKPFGIKCVLIFLIPVLNGQWLSFLKLQTWVDSFLQCRSPVLKLPAMSAFTHSIRSSFFGNTKAPFKLQIPRVFFRPLNV